LHARPTTPTAFKGDTTYTQSATPGRPQVTWQAAPLCVSTPDARNSVRDSQGQLWGWEGGDQRRGQSCAFRSIDTDSPTVTWQAAPICPDVPNYATAVRDRLGRLWGYHNGQSCKYVGAGLF
jgi:hypothetical protein